MTAMELMPILDSLHKKIEQQTTQAGDVGYQAISLFTRMAKIIVTSTPTLRGATDWELAARDDVDQDDSAAGDTGSQIVNGACTVFGLLIRTNSTAAERSWIVLQDNVDAEFDGTAALANGTEVCVQQAVANATSAHNYSAWLFPHGVAIGTELDIRADGRDGTDPAANEYDAWILLRGTLA